MKKTVIKILSTLLYRLNKTTSFNEMYDKLKEFAKLQGQEFCVLKVCKNAYDDGIKIKSYVHSFTWVEANTLEECIELLKEYKNRTPKESVIKEVLI